MGFGINALCFCISRSVNDDEVNYTSQRCRGCFNIKMLSEGDLSNTGWSRSIKSHNVTNLGLLVLSPSTRDSTFLSGGALTRGTTEQHSHAVLPFTTTRVTTFYPKLVHEATTLTAATVPTIVKHLYEQSITSKYSKKTLLSKIYISELSFSSYVKYCF